MKTLAVIAFAGLLAACGSATSPMSPVLAVITSSAHYRAADSVLVSETSISDQSLLLSPCPSLERFGAAGWVAVESSALCIGSLVILGPGQTRQVHSALPPTLASGVYRYVTTVAYDAPGSANLPKDFGASNAFSVQ